MRRAKPFSPEGAEQDLSLMVIFDPRLVYNDQGAALGTDAEQGISPERAAQAVSPLQGCL